MNAILLFVFLAISTCTILSVANEQEPKSKVIVMGTVFCATCQNNSFSMHSYFLSGVKVHIECKFRANTWEAESISHLVNTTTNKFGIYEFEWLLPTNRFECIEGHTNAPFCKASLLQNPSRLCSVPGLKTSTEHMAMKSKQGNQCTYSLNALNYNMPKRDAVCGHLDSALPSTVNDSKFFFPPFGLPFPLYGFPFPQLPPLPQFPPLPQIPPFPRLPPWPPLPLPFTPSPVLSPTSPGFPFPSPYFPPFTPSSPPALPFPFPQFPPFPPPFNPSPPPSLPLPFPHFPPFSPLFTPSPPPPPFSLGDPKSWFPFLPPSPPVGSPQRQHP